MCTGGRGLHPEGWGLFVLEFQGYSGALRAAIVPPPLGVNAPGVHCPHDAAIREVRSPHAKGIWGLVPPGNSVLPGNTWHNPCRKHLARGAFPPCQGKARVMAPMPACWYEVCSPHAIAAARYGMVLAVTRCVDRVRGTLSKGKECGTEVATNSGARRACTRGYSWTGIRLDE